MTLGCTGMDWCPMRGTTTSVLAARGGVMFVVGLFLGTYRGTQSNDVANCDADL